MAPWFRIQPSNHSTPGTRVVTTLSLLSSLAILSILAFFIDALRRASMPVPWPILLLLSASCTYILNVVSTAVLRGRFPSSTILQLAVHLLIAVLWIVTVTLLADQLNHHLTRRCPPSSVYGHDMWTVCHLYKTIFWLTALNVVCVGYLAVENVLAWTRTRKTAQYTAMEGNKGNAGPTMGIMSRKHDNMGRATGLGMFRAKRAAAQEDQQDIMMRPIQTDETEGRDERILRPDNDEPRAYPSLRDRAHVDGYADRFAGQDTRYDPGSKMY